jgi:hypothetical protein
MKSAICIAALVFAAALPASALAAPGLGSKVYGTGVEQGEFELESRHAGLTGGPDDGGWVWVGEAAYGFTDRFYGALLVEAERESGLDPEFAAVAFEGLYEVGEFGGVGLALYGEYEATLHGGPDAIEFKALFQRAAGRFGARLNLIAERPLEDAAEWEFGYAAQADVEVLHDLRLGVQAFGDFGDEHGWGGRRAHFVGPAAEVEFDDLPVEGELEVAVGYLFAAGASRHDADGQARLTVEYKRTF